ncbi:MAG: VWA domain-containing protein [Anaerolineae bacterium]|nr:MAG: VWA domain-containing protein [Anaerolineae bacterium]
MDKRMIEFIRCLRAAGVRVSLAESQDAMQAIDEVGISGKEIFHDAMLSTLVKEHRDQYVFEHFFPLFFGSGVPPMHDMTQELSPQQQQTLQQALQSLTGNDNALQQLMQQLMQGRPFSQDELNQMAQMSGMANADSPYQENWFARRMEREAKLNELRDLMEQLLDQLRQAGMSEEAVQEIREMMENNLDALAEQLANFAGLSIAQNMAEREPQPQDDVMDMPFQYLSPEEADQVRDEIRRLAAKLRARAALRQKRAKVGNIDLRRTFRSNLRYGGVPLELKRKTRHVKPRVVAICDLSGSMRYMSEFALTLTYMLQDLVAKARSFIFIDDMVEVTHHFKNNDPQEAVEIVLRENPRGSYNTNLGYSLQTFEREFLDSVDSKTTILLVGDGRNNYNDPRLDITEMLQRRARRLLWFCPEPDYQWGTGDSDMHQYAPVSDGVFLVRNLRELGEAVDQILGDG